MLAQALNAAYDRVLTSMRYYLSMGVGTTKEARLVRVGDTVWDPDAMRWIGVRRITVRETKLRFEGDEGTVYFGGYDEVGVVSSSAASASGRDPK